MLGELVAYLWSFFSGATTALQLILHPDWVVKTWKEAIRIIRGERE